MRLVAEECMLLKYDADTTKRHTVPVYPVSSPHPSLTVYRDGRKETLHRDKHEVFPHVFPVLVWEDSIASLYNMILYYIFIFTCVTYTYESALKTYPHNIIATQMCVNYIWVEFPGCQGWISGESKDDDEANVKRHGSR